MNCPHCGKPISPKLAAKALRSKKSEWRAQASRENGALGGRPLERCPLSVMSEKGCRRCTRAADHDGDCEFKLNGPFDKPWLRE